MMLGSFTKQPSDVFDYDVEYDDWLPSTDELATSQVMVEPASTLAVDAVYVVGNRVNIWVSAGTAGASYKLTVTTTTTAGRVRQDEFRIKVKEF